MITLLSLIKVTQTFQPLLLEGDVQHIGSSAEHLSDIGLTVRVIRGCKIRTLTGAFNEFAAALQFPLYFGENKDAFEECISDMETLSAEKGYVLIITNPEQVLAEEATGEFRWLVETLEAAATTWGSPIELGQPWDRPGMPFHVILAGSSTSLTQAEEKWSSAGWTPYPLTSVESQ